MKAIEILWGTDGRDVELPNEIEVPDYMEDENEISDYLSDLTGFCHNGFYLVD